MPKPTERQTRATIKKLIEQRDEAVAKLEAELSSPLIGKLQLRVTDLERALVVVEKERDSAAWDSKAQTDRVEDLTSMRNADKIERRLLDDAHEKELRAATEKLSTLQKELADFKVAARLDDVATLKKRLAAKAEELRVALNERGAFKARADTAGTELAYLRRLVSLLPVDIVREAEHVARGTPIVNGAPDLRKAT